MHLHNSTEQLSRKAEHALGVFTRSFSQSAAASTIGNEGTVRIPVYPWLERVWEAELDPNTKLVCLAICHGVSDLSVRQVIGYAKLEKKTGLKKRALIDHVKRAQLAGFISVGKHHSVHGRHPTNKYRLVVPGRDPLGKGSRQFRPVLGAGGEAEGDRASQFDARDLPKKVPVHLGLDAIFSADVNHTTKLVCLAIVRALSDLSQPVCLPYETLMAWTGLSNKSIATQVQRAVEAGLIDMEKIDGQSGRFAQNRYRVRVPDGLRSEPPVGGDCDRSAGLGRVNLVHTAPCELGAPGPVNVVHPAPCELGAPGPVNVVHPILYQVYSTSPLPPAVLLQEPSLAQLGSAGSQTSETHEGGASRDESEVGSARGASCDVVPRTRSGVLVRCKGQPSNQTWNLDDLVERRGAKALVVEKLLAPVFQKGRWLDVLGDADPMDVLEEIARMGASCDVKTLDTASAIALTRHTNITLKHFKEALEEAPKELGRVARCARAQEQQAQDIERDRRRAAGIKRDDTLADPEARMAQQLLNRLGEPIFKAWFEPFRLVSFDDAGTLTMVVKTPLHVNWIERHYEVQVRAVAEQEVPEVRAVRFTPMTSGGAR